MIHNETGLYSVHRFGASLCFERMLTYDLVNIWPHLLGALFYSLIPLYYYPDFRSRYRSAAITDLITLAVYFLGVTVCYTFSSLYVVLLHQNVI